MADDAERAKIEAEFIERVQEAMRHITVRDFLAQNLATLSSMAFQRMGLTEQTRDDRDLAQSRLAIDAFRSIVDVLASVASADEVALYRSTLSQMQLAYVGQLGGESGSGGPAAAESQEAGSTTGGATGAEAETAERAEEGGPAESEEAGAADERAEG